MSKLKNKSVEIKRKLSAQTITKEYEEILNKKSDKELKATLKDIRENEFNPIPINIPIY